MGLKESSPVTPELPLHPNLTIEGQDATGRYLLYAREVNPPTAKNNVMIVFTHGAAPNNMDPQKNSNPMQLYSYFQDRFAKEGFSSIVFHTRGVGKDVKVNDTLSIPMQSDRLYQNQSLNDRITDLTQVLLTIESRPDAPQKYILSGVSMGADTSTRVLQNLLDIVADDNPNEDIQKNRALALSLINKISGLMLFAPAAYRNEEGMYTRPAGDPERQKLLRRRLHHEKEYPLDDAEKGSDTFTKILPRTRYWYPNGVPLFVAGRADDEIVKETHPIYRKEVYRSEDFILIPGTQHEGLLKAITDPSDPRENVFQSAIAFAKRVKNG